ncbi:hypothetical protein DBV15_02377 [Temnothorax longispinosus]|uniref:Uncharacterized protein n=1 Tax=Temnothorax longispinosus TaxID=300112 RepID=A0A4V3S7X2_9HYME|nr:hypothetical protein DBV15_02377 [Temnothorax longispinosus]
MRPPDQCSGGSGHDARRSRRGTSRRWRAGKPTRRKARMRKAQSTSGILARNPDTRCALPGDHCARSDARRPLRRAGILAGVRNTTHVRPLNFARLSWPDERERERERETDRESGVYLGELTTPGTIRTCVSPSGVSCFYFNRNLGNVCHQGITFLFFYCLHFKLNFYKLHI